MNELPERPTRLFKLARVVGGGLAALFFALVIAALTVFGVINVVLGHVFMAFAWLVGVVLICTEILPGGRPKHQTWAICGLGLIMVIGDAGMLKLKHLAESAPPSTLPKSPSASEIADELVKKLPASTSSKAKEKSPTDAKNDLFIELLTGEMPPAVPNGQIYYAMSPFPDGGGGLGEQIANDDDRLRWSKEIYFARQKGYQGIPVLVYRVTNYSGKTLVDVEMAPVVTYFESVVGDPNGLLAVKVAKPWPITIQKIDPGPANAFVFYVLNDSTKQFLNDDRRDHT